ncbi:MAG: endo-1,3-alpha-glucanase family glycosylhydrolase [Victivallales bacterium]|jgi:formylglycine-generating enzyme required for sulfatase activity
MIGKKCLFLTVMAALASTLLPAKADDAAAPSKHFVFAHYMTCFSATPEFYQREIVLAQRYGIDGFALNCGEWKKTEKDGKLVDTRYVTNADRIYQAAKDLDSGFKLFMSPDFACIPINEWTKFGVDDMFTRYFKHPNQFQYRGKVFQSGYAGLPEKYTPIAEQLRKSGYDFLLVPAVGRSYHPMAWSLETVLNFFQPGNKIDGMFYFSCDGTVNDLINTNATARRGTLFADKIFMAGSVPAYNSPNLRDFRGMSGYCSIWEGLIRDQADLVEIVTWNDYNEDSNLMPYRWKSGYGNAALHKDYYNRDESYLDVTSYYVNWFKNDVKPDITQDKIYFSYRIRSKDQHQVWDEKENRWVDVRFCTYPYDQLHDDVHDAVNVTAFLTADAELTVTLGKTEKTFTLAKGISNCEIPMEPGVPRFILKRNSKPLIDVSGRRTIIDQPTKENSVKGGHLAYRTWTSGAAAGPLVQTLQAERDIELGVTPNDQIVLQAGKLENSPYNFRVTYCNPSDKETRLTLYADGAPGANSEQPNYFPLFLPPTGKEFRTVSFFWSMWDKTTKLTIRNDQTTDPNLSKNDYNDHGTATIRKIDLIKVNIFTSKPSTATAPELILLPAGSFTMGDSKSVQPDEVPAHQVTLPSFALGKYEVTNAEYERFMPEHRKRRDGFSWRDKEPVIYVSWTDSARYCNWLSKQYGLTSVYNEKDWTINMQADGFRLPTEAEWEYAATGRGENRIYPWGNKPPEAELGNFELEKSLSISPKRTASTGGGVSIVGDYPKGSSRDGLMDMAGNVGEWCSDYYNPYPNVEQSNPCDQQVSPHRSIRGGSWGYYNWSQRNKDREFNNTGYPGYIYLGIRVAVSAEGFAKLKGK